MSATEAPPTETRPAAETGAEPVVLFDGVCNLCDAWVQWILARDRDARFRFASLQSEAARGVLSARLDEAAVDALPDTIVLVDEAGVHVRSTAVLRIARQLGFPWKAAGLLLAIPRPLRDAVYDFVAHRRYRWFGRQAACPLPTPELAARFLDRDEPRRVVDPPGPAAPDAAAPRTPVRSWALRFVIAYLVLYMLPFPFSLVQSTVGRVGLIGDIPWLWEAYGAVLGAWGALSGALVKLTGGVLFGVDAQARPTGSGDQTFNYVKLVVDAGLAVGVSLVWTAVARGRRLSPGGFDLSRVLARYYLGTTLLVYGWIKVFPLQMPPPGPDRLLQPYGDSSPMGIAWTFIGASLAYQVFSGLSECVAGYLLFWRRTALAGALAGMAVMLNVMAINYFYDVPVKLFSTHLFLMGLFVAAPDLPRLIGFFGFGLPLAADASPPFWRRWGWSGHAIATANLVLVGLLTWFHVQDGVQASRTRGVLAEVPALEGIYVVESFERDGVLDRANEDADRWVRVGVNVPGLATIQRATGEAVRMLMALDTLAHTVSFYDRGGQPPESPAFTYSVPEDGTLRLEGTFEGAPTVVLMRKASTEALLTGRGFRWINEYPFNR